MTSGVPWQVIGVGRQARETAREAAEPDHNRRDAEAAARAPKNPQPTAPGEGRRRLSDNFAAINDRLENLARRLEQLAQIRLAATPPAPLHQGAKADFTG